MVVKNPSTKEKTLKGEYISSVKNKWNIDKFILYSNYDEEVFVPDLTLMDNYRDYFEEFLIDYDIDKKYYYSPSYFAQEYYGDPELDFLVLYFAKMISLFEFKEPTIKVLPPEKLNDLNKLAIKYEDQVALSRRRPSAYVKRSRIDIGQKEYSVVPIENANVYNPLLDKVIRGEMRAGEASLFIDSPQPSKSSYTGNTVQYSAEEIREISTTPIMYMEIDTTRVFKNKGRDIVELKKL